MNCGDANHYKKPLSFALLLIAATVFATHCYGTDSVLQTFQTFVNGGLPIKEAVVCRRILNTNGIVQNEEWWRFGQQDSNRTWYLERDVPHSKNPSKLVRRTNDATVGASFANLWSVSDRNIHIADKSVSLGSGPDSYGTFGRHLMFSALSLGVPRRQDLRAITDSQIEWSGTNFTTEVTSKHGTNGSVLATARITGKLTLGTNGLPVSADIPAVGDAAACSVKYDYADSNAVLPSVFTIKYPGRIYRFEFLSLKLGTNDLSATGGYAPSLFADTTLQRHVTLWTNDRPYSLVDGKTRPAFRPPAPKLGDPAPALHGSAWFNTAHPLTLDELRGKVVLIDFWGMWCAPCFQHLPHLQAEYARFKDRGLVVIGIHTAWGTEKHLDKFLNDHGITFPVAVDTEISWEGMHVGATSHSYVLDALPSYALVDKSGDLVWKSSDSIEPTVTQIEQLLDGVVSK